ncbi:MAG: hypothetical protein HY033_06500 [Ignavibacteriae bacterium]|nr:hypothetical protein [Ignavibacteria bacterium]MBI3364541.1 hypothetical protein [Ignavibacteriota bacterium]
MGVVYKAENTKLDWIVAIKFFSKRLSAHGEKHELLDFDAHGRVTLTDVTADGSRFLISNSPAGLVQPITMVTNWDKELKKK